MASGQCWSQHKHNMRDPLWWVLTISLLGAVFLNLYQLAFGKSPGIDWSSALVSLMAVTFVAEAARGTSIGERRPISRRHRIGDVVFAIVCLLVVLAFSLL